MPLKDRLEDRLEGMILREDVRTGGSALGSGDSEKGIGDEDNDRSRL